MRATEKKLLNRTYEGLPVARDSLTSASSISSSGVTRKTSGREALRRGDIGVRSLQEVHAALAQAQVRP